MIDPSSAFFIKRRNHWFRRRWLDFRQGHSIYLVFLMTFANFITIQYNLLIERLPVVSSLFTNIWIFAITFVALYLPVSILIGYWHRKSQWKVEAEAMFKENEIGAKMWLFLIDLVEGKATEEEKENMRELLEKIAKKNSTTISTIDKDKKTAESRAYNGLKKF